MGTDILARALPRQKKNRDSLSCGEGRQDDRSFLSAHELQPRPLSQLKQQNYTCQRNLRKDISLLTSLRPITQEKGAVVWAGVQVETL